MKSTWKKCLLYATYTLLASGLLYGLLQLILSGYAVDWTGFQTKTLWDWMDLLIIPIVLALGAFFLNRSERAIERENNNNRAEFDRQIADERRVEDRKLAEERANLEREIAKDQQQEQALNTYLDRMSELLLEKELRTTKNSEVRNVARTHTLKILQVLDKFRKGVVIKFLYETSLITGKEPIIKLNDAELSEVELPSSNLNGINFEGAILIKANFTDAKLDASIFEKAIAKNANFLRANLKSANLKKADFQYCNLHESNLQGADLERADLRVARLSSVQFEGANLRGTSLINADLMAARLAGADLYAALLDHVNFKFADLSGALNLHPEDLINVKSLESASLPHGFEVHRFDDSK